MPGNFIPTTGCLRKQTKEYFIQMDIQTLREIIKDLPDDMPVIVEIDNGFISACSAESDVVKLPNGEEAFYLAPCFCQFKTDQIDLLPGDFPTN